ncbi:MAG TPA: endo-1,4-beta-xylanase [Bryobacteraceae bacterium]|nr:endo-1,4-beta-xylanase [Bryobacteraceae bacterium]
MLRCTCIVMVALTMFCARPIAAQVVATYDFEDGTAQGWASFNGASIPANSTAAAFSGTHSLLTTTNSSGSGGPSINLSSILVPGATYTITGHVLLTPGESATDANFTIKRSDPACAGGTCFDTIGAFQVPVSSSGWAQIGGTYTVSTTETGLTLYAQLIGPSTATSFYLDDVVITETAPPPTGTSVATYTFGDGGLDGWFPFGSPTLTNVAPPVLDPFADTRSLLVSNRTSGFMGPALNLLSVPGVTAGAIYSVTAYVLLAAPDSSNPTATLSTELTNCANSSGIFTNLGTSSALSTTAWTKVQGNFSFSNVPGPPTALTLYIQSSSATDSFYISHVTITEVSPPPIPVSQQDNTGISTNFEDGGLDGWTSRSGSSTLANSTTTAHGGTHSLLITGRTANFDGPQINVSNKMYPGSAYALSVWVQLAPTDGSTHIINMSLQVTLGGNTSFPGITGFPGVSVVADGNWHQISVPRFNMSFPYDPGAALLYLQTFPSSGSDLVSFYIDDFQLTYLPPPTIQTGIPSIFQTFSSYFPIGAEIDSSDLSGPHAQLLTKHFNSIVSGNDMKWISVEPTKGTFTYSTADNEVGFAACNNMLVRGHNLVWANGQQTPSYAFGDGTNSQANQAAVIANIQEHIQNEVEHFGNKVYVWDVVNEPIDPNQPDCLSHGPFYQVLGKSYIDIALQAARQFAPAGTELFINDFSTTDPNRLACLVQVVQDLKNRGIPIDGVGHEMHNAINFPSTAAIVNAINTIATHFPGIKQQITELDVSVYHAGDNTSNFGANGGTVPASILAEQGYLYEQYFNALRQLKGKLQAVTFWGFADDDTWLDSFPIVRLDMPLPFDTDLHAKPAYWGMVDPTQLPGFGLTFKIASKTGTQSARVWTITATNPSSTTAYGTQITGFTLTQTGGAACTPVITPPSSFPVSLGDIPGSGMASASFTIDFTGCSATARFTLTAPWNSAVYHTGTLVSGSQFQ